MECHQHPELILLILLNLKEVGASTLVEKATNKNLTLKKEKIEVFGQWFPKNNMVHYHFFPVVLLNFSFTEIIQKDSGQWSLFDPCKMQLPLQIRGAEIEKNTFLIRTC